MVTTTSDAISILIKYLASIARPISIVIYAKSLNTSSSGFTYHQIHGPRRNK